MSTSRERYYRCTLTTRTGTLTGHVRAWDERAAAQQFREELTSSGVEPRGTVVVKNLAGGEEYSIRRAG